MRITERLRGRAAAAQRLRRLAREPLCVDCKGRGITTASTVPDHVPLSKGGTDTTATFAAYVLTVIVTEQQNSLAIARCNRSVLMAGQCSARSPKTLC